MTCELKRQSASDRLSLWKPAVTDDQMLLLSCDHCLLPSVCPTVTHPDDTHTHTQAKWQSDTRTPLFTAHQRASNLHLSPWQPSWCASFFWGNRGPRKQRFLGGFDRDGDQSGTKDDFYQDCRPVQPLLPLLLKGKTCAIATWSQWIYCAFSKILLSYCIVGRASIKVACPWGLAFASNLE